MIEIIEIKRFEKCDDQQYTFGIANRIAGANGAGKSRVFRAFLWCLHGIGPHGGTVPLAQSDGWHVRVFLADGTEIVRMVNGKTSLYIDRLPANQGQIDARYGTAAQQACVTFPTSFFSFDECERKDLLTSIAKKPSLGEIFDKHFRDETTGDIVIDWTIPVEQHHKTVKQSLAHVNIQIDEIERKVAKIDAQAQLLSGAKRHPMEEINAMKVNLEEQSRAISEAIANNTRLLDYEVSVARYQSEVSATKARRNVAKESKPTVTEDELEAQRENLEQALEKARTTEANLAEAETAGKKLAAEIELAKTQTACPLCKREYENSEQIKAVAEEKERQKTALIATFKTMKKEAEAAKKFYVEQQKLTKDMAGRLEEHKAAYASLELPSAPPVVSTDGFGFTTSKQGREHIASLQTQAKNLQEYIAKAQIVASTEDLGDIAKHMAHLEKLDKQRKLFARLIEATHPMRGIEQIAAKETLGSLDIPGFDFVFEKTLGNGSVKQCCEVLRKADGVLVDHLSTGQKLKFGVLLAQAILANTKTIPSLFVESADVMDSLQVPSGVQFSVERVVKGEPLTVEIKKGFP